MNQVMLTGRPTKAPEVRYAQDGKAVARFSLAVDRYKDGADFISCVAFGKTAEFIEKYVNKGVKYAVVGHIRTGSYDGKNGKVYTTDVVIDSIEFCERKAESQTASAAERKDDWMPVPEDEELPFA